MMMKVGSAYSKDISFTISHLAAFLNAVGVSLNMRSLIDGIVKLLEEKIDKHEPVEADIIQIYSKIKSNSSLLKSTYSLET